MQEKKRKIGILGGTFNPIHYGHLMIGDNALHQFGLDEVIYMPTGHAPHKQFSGDEMAEHRCRMVEAAISDNPDFSISYYEVNTRETSYTYRTLQHFHRKNPDAELYFLLGLILWLIFRPGVIRS